MNDAKFSMNALLLIVIIFMAIGFFFTVKLGRLADHSVVNEYYPIEGTDLGVRYATLEPSGIVRGGRNSKDLKLEGSFGYDWGAALEGNALWLNEYTKSALGLMHCRVIRVDLADFSTEEKGEDMVLRGRCASGELVCLRGYLLPVCSPEVNPLCGLYALPDRELSLKGERAEVLFLDPATGEILCRVWDEAALSDSFEERYLRRSLEEVRG